MAKVPFRRSYYRSVIVSAPIAYWRLGESSGTTAVDSSGNGLDGTYVNSPSLGEPGALAGDDDTGVVLESATGDRVVLGDLSFPTDACSVEFWANTHDLAEMTDPYETLLWRGDDAFSIFYRAESERLEWKHVTSGGDARVYTYDVPADVWYHCICTWDGSRAYIYIDGVDVSGGGVARTGTFADNASNWYLGRSAAFASWNGGVDEVAIYDRALSADEIAAHYAAGITP